MKKEDVIKSCYSLLRSVTPLDFDCGKLCDGKCCKGDEKTGMLLFPGEEKLIDHNINVIETDNGEKLAGCNGGCDRNRRPVRGTLFLSGHPDVRLRGYKCQTIRPCCFLLLL